MKGQNDRKKKSLYIIIIVFLLLLLITSCNSNLLGKIGGLFKNSGDFVIDKDTNDLEEVLNQDLTFDGEEFDMSLSDNNLKISFSLKNVNSSEFTCTTNDANIATCYVQDGYVVINPKSIGVVNVFLETHANNKIYKASTKVKIEDKKRKIELSKTSGNIYLGSSRIKYVTFNLIDLTGNIIVKSSNEEIAIASIYNKTLKIEALKSGSTTITLSLEYNGRVYTADYKITILEGKNPNAIKTNNGTNISDDNNSSSNNDNNYANNNEKPISPSNPITPSEPTNTENPDIKPPSDTEPTIKITKDITECFLETGCSIEFKVTQIKNGIKQVITNQMFNKLITEENPNLLYEFSYEDEDLGIAKLLITPKNLIPSNVTIKFGLENNLINKTINFKFSKNYQVSTKVNNYEMALINGTAEKDIIIDTNLFNDEVDTSNENNIFTIFDKNNPTTRIEITSLNNKITNISYDNKEKGPKSINLKVTANEEGSEILKVTAYVNDIDINSSFEIGLNIVKEYIINLDANGGYFDIYTKKNIYSFKYKENDSLDLSKYIPFKTGDETNCKSYKFLGYSEDKNAEESRYNNTITIDRSMDLYAIYENNLSKTPEDQVFKTIWVDAKILEDKINKTNLIYPGSYGYYELNFENTTGFDINLIGLSMVEDTVCTNAGCVNMGYVIKYSNKEDDNYDYYLIKDAPKPLDKYHYEPQNYRILNGGRISTRNSLEIDFKKQSLDNIFIEKDKTATISLFWQWVDNDKIDTEIGKKVALDNEDTYSLSIGINFTNANNCK